MILGTGGNFAIANQKMAEQMTKARTQSERVFLFLQGPHGPFFHQLSKQLENAGARIWRVGFNAGDSAFWPDGKSYIAFRDPLESWKTVLASILDSKSVTDIVLYGEARPIHAQAIEVAKARSLRVHIFEEGYLRPYWVTYERDGSNGNSQLMKLLVEDMRAAQRERSFDPPMPPSHWGDLSQHVFYGALYHWFVMAMNRSYPGFQPHRALTVGQEFRLYIKRLLLMPLHAIDRRIASLRIKLGNFPYHLALLQLEHDASFQEHGPFDRQADFAETVLQAFAEGAPAHHHIVFKAHPLEDGRSPVRADIRRLGRKYDLKGRVHFVGGGKLARLLDEARSAITVNSTAGQQALWRGVPLKIFGTCVYDKDELVSRQNLKDFFRAPQKSDPSDYRIYRDFLLATSQLPGSFYAAKGRRQLLRRVCDMMLASKGPYEINSRESEADRQHISLVR